MFKDACNELNVGRRRIFWTTRPEECGTYELCGTVCSIPGLRYEERDEGRTINNEEWLLSLILNILNTRARTDIPCPAPSGVYGHWSESYRQDGMNIGSLLWNAAEKSYRNTAASVTAIKTAVQTDMGKLIAMGVADTVEVDARYVGGNKVAISILPRTRQGGVKINLSGQFVAGTWVWYGAQ